MDTSVKYRIISEIINTKDEDILNAVKALLNIDDETDLWDDLNAEDKAAIDEAIDQLNNGRFVTHESVQLEVKKRFNF